MRDFKKLKLWEKAHLLVLEIYKVTSKFPKEERYGIVDQMRRSAVSLPNNIAEGCGRNTKKELLYFLNISMGFASELEYLLLLSYDINYLNTNYKKLNDDLIEVRKMLNKYMQKIENDIN